MICESYALIDKPVPVRKRADYIFLKYLKLNRKYSPTRFEGDILLFRTIENLSSQKYLGWETLVNSIRLVEIKGKHLEIFTNKENTDIVQTEIEKWLEQANGFK